MSLTVETLALGDRVVIGANPTKAPVGKVGRIMSITENGSLIVEVDHDRFLLPVRCVDQHEGPPPGREMVSLGRSTVEPPRDATPLMSAVDTGAAHGSLSPSRDAEPAEPAPKPTRKAWRTGDRVQLTRDQRDGLAAGTTGTIFGSSAVLGYFQVKTAFGVQVVIGEDLELAIPHETPPIEGFRQVQPVATAPTAETRKKRGPQSEAHRQAIRDGKARKKAAREGLADVVVEEISDPDRQPAPATPALRSVERPAVVDLPAMQENRSADKAPSPATGVHDALRWAIGQGARQNLSVAALRMIIDTLEAVEREVLP